MNLKNKDRKKPFSPSEKELFVNILQKFDTIVSSKQTNARSSYQKKVTWEKITEEFNTSSIVSQQASTKQLMKLWYNMKARAREAKTNENVGLFTGAGPAVADIEPIDAKVMDIHRNIRTNIEVEIDSDDYGPVVIVGDNNNEAWSKPNEKTLLPELNQSSSSQNNISTSPPKQIKGKGEKNNRIDQLKCQILEEELEHKRKIHQEELEIKILEREYKEKLYNIDLQIKYKTLHSLNN